QPNSANGPSAAPSVPPAAPGLPALLAVSVQLTAPITSRDAVGATIHGTVAAPVLRKGRVEIPSGAAVTGRIRRLEKYPNDGPPEFIVGLEFTELETPAGPVPFYADLLRLERRPGIRPTFSRRVLVRTGTEYEPRDEAVTLPELPGVASFF